jgi:four helix bundle protein
MFDFHKLRIWQRSVAFTAAVTRATQRRRGAPRDLVSQLVRACNSVHANIAEAAGKSTPRHKAHCLDIAIGELNEAESFLTLASATHAIDDQLASEFINEAQEIRRMTLRYKQYVLRKVNMRASSAPPARALYPRPRDP